jgi:predicted acetyltransferase
MQLVLPSIKYKKEFLEAFDESIDEGDTRLSQAENNESFEEYVKRANENAKGQNLLKGHVPATTYWLMDKGELIGRTQIRHELNDFLLKANGHIGYYIRPSKRKMGYGKEILRLALLEAKKLGLSKVLIDCDEDNIGSRKIIEANGGELEGIVEIEKGKPKRRRYWITVK